jgi:RNA polymerase sigma factor (sigma-70 family)
VAGDGSATHALLIALVPHLIRGVRSVLGARSADLDDVAQEATLVLLRALPSFRGQSTVARFARGTAVLVALNERRRLHAEKRGRGVLQDLPEPDHLASDHPGPEQRLREVEAARAARALLLTLPQPQAEVLALHCMAGYTLAEIAETTRAPLETVRSRLRLAKQALRRSLENEPHLLEVLRDA